MTAVTLPVATAHIAGPLSKEVDELNAELEKLLAAAAARRVAQARVALKKVKAERARAKYLGEMYIPWLFGRAGSALTALGDYDRLSDESRRKLNELSAGASRLEREAKNGNWDPDVLEQQVKALAQSIGMDSVQADLAKVQQPYVNAFGGGSNSGTEADALAGDE